METRGRALDDAGLSRLVYCGVLRSTVSKIAGLLVIFGRWDGNASWLALLDFRKDLLLSMNADLVIGNDAKRVSKT
jgi:hypothetical protein